MAHCAASAHEGCRELRKNSCQDDDAGWTWYGCHSPCFRPQGRNGGAEAARPDGDGTVPGGAKPRFHSITVRDSLRAIVERLAQPGELERSY